jgi:hypothetical protein
MKMTTANDRDTIVGPATMSAHTYPITKEATEKKLNNIKDTLPNNEYTYNINLGTTHPNQHKHNKITNPQHQKTKWATFTYSGKEIKIDTKLFKETQIKVAFPT